MTPIMWWLVSAAVCAGALGALANGIAGAKGTVAASRGGAAWESVALALLITAGMNDHGPRNVRDLLLAGLVCALAARLLSLFWSTPIPDPSNHALPVYATVGAALSAPEPGSVESGYWSGPPRHSSATRHPVRWLNASLGVRMTLTMSSVLLYALAMQQHRTDDVSVVFGLVVVLLTIFAFGYRMIAGGEVLGGSTLAIAIAAYLAAVGCMVVLGVGTASLLIAYGSLTLASSQLVLIAHHIVRRGRWSPAVASAASCAGLAAIVIGLMR